MPERKSVYISEVMNMVSTPIIYVGRLSGLFPFTIQKEKSKLQLIWSLKYVVYSFILGSALVISTIRGMVDDLLVDSSRSIRMSQETSKYVTIGDISIVVLIVLIGIFGTPFRISNFLAYIDCINETDSILVISDARKAKTVSILRLAIALTITTAILCCDLAMWWTFSGKSLENNFFIENYLPFYISYYVVVILECQYWQLVHSIERRLKLLNGCLHINDFTADDILKTFENKAFSIFNTSPESNKQSISITPRNVGNVIDTLGKQHRIEDIFFIKNANKVRNLTKYDYIVTLTRVYLKLCDAADFINKCCGLPVLIILTSCLLHLVVTPYFLVLELSGRRNILFSVLQTVWLLTHVCRLIIIVEACYACTSQAKNTRPLVCKLLCYNFHNNFKKQLELFATELYHRQIEYTACGLVTIDRTLITSITGAVTTYLVILIQFQKSDG